MLREKMLDKLEEMWGGDLPVQNSWDSVLDEGISKGSTNWQLYGSRKPGNEAYVITQFWKIKYDPSDGQLGIDSANIDEIDLSNTLTSAGISLKDEQKVKRHLDNILKKHQLKVNDNISPEIKSINIQDGKTNVNVYLNINISPANIAPIK